MPRHRKSHSSAARTIIRVQTFRDLMDGASYAEIINSRGDVVRKLSLTEGGNVLVDALTVKVVVEIDAPLYYEPWFMDRGSLLFSAPSIGQAKLCTEGDIIRYDDGSKLYVEPHASLLPTVRR